LDVRVAGGCTTTTKYGGIHFLLPHFLAFWFYNWFFMMVLIYNL